MGVAIMKRYRSVICFPCGTCTQDISIYRIDIPFIYPSMKPAHDCPCPFSRIWSWKTLRFRMRKKSICTWSILRPWSNSVSSIWLSSFAAIISAFSLRWVPCSSCYIYIFFQSALSIAVICIRTPIQSSDTFFWGGVQPLPACSEVAPCSPRSFWCGTRRQQRRPGWSEQPGWEVGHQHSTWDLCGRCLVITIVELEIIFIYIYI